MFHTKKFRVYHYSRHLFPIFTKNKQKLQKFCGNKPVLPKLFTPEFAHDLPMISPSFPRHFPVTLHRSGTLSSVCTCLHLSRLA